jgi:hypothetical protein
VEIFRHFGFGVANGFDLHCYKHVEKIIESDFLQVRVECLMMVDQKRTPKFAQARESLPEELRPVYDQLVEEYGFYALKHQGRRWVSYAIIAELVRDGWRPTR